EFDGAGGIAADEAHLVADVSANMAWDTPPVACKADEQFAGRTNFTTEQRVRIALAWNSDPNHGATMLFQLSGLSAPTGPVVVGSPTAGDWPDQPSRFRPVSARPEQRRRRAVGQLRRQLRDRRFSAA